MARMQQPEPRPEIKFIVMGPGLFGLGETLDEAKREFRRIGGRLGKNPHIIWDFSQTDDIVFSHIDGMGTIHWFDEKETGTQPVKTERYLTAASGR